MSSQLDRLKEIVSRDGVRAGLAYLNSLTAHRFTALYQFVGDRRGTLRSTYFYDRREPEVQSCPEIPVAASYCVFVRDGGRPFQVDDSQADARVAGHPKRDTVRSYCGVPLMDAGGRMIGTICHFDFVPSPLGQGDVELMEAMASLLRPNL